MYELCFNYENYEATEADELSFKVGEIIVLTGKDDPGWWTGACNGRTGLFPRYDKSDIMDK